MVLNQKIDRSRESALVYLEIKQYLAESCSKVAHPFLSCSFRRGMGVRAVVAESLSLPVGGTCSVSTPDAWRLECSGTVTVGGEGAMAGCCGTCIEFGVFGRMLEVGAGESCLSLFGRLLSGPFPARSPGGVEFGCAGRDSVPVCLGRV